MSETFPIGDGCPAGPAGSDGENPYHYTGPHDAFVSNAPQTTVTPAAAEPRWGFWATAGLGVVVVGLFIVLQTAVAIPFVFMQISADKGKVDSVALAALGSNGLLLGLATLVSVPPSAGLTVLFAKLKRGATVRGYLGFHGVTPRVAGIWIGITLVYVAAADGLTHQLGRPIVAPFMVAAYTTAGFLPLLWIALIVLAPLFEEIFFRGFLLEG
ncbi:MAG TPA: hypothetical protein VGX76_00075, partial [Pirellulales bacterium]|nr:hypothetical protein [Pirellulales bacterium]